MRSAQEEHAYHKHIGVNATANSMQETCEESIGGGGPASGTGGTATSTGSTTRGGEICSRRCDGVAHAITQGIRIGHDLCTQGGVLRIVAEALRTGTQDVEGVGEGRRDLRLRLACEASAKHNKRHTGTQS